MEIQGFSSSGSPAIPVRKLWLPGEWASCDICRAMRLAANLTSLCYTFKHFDSGERCLHFCSDNESCREKALEKKQAAES